MSRFSTMIVVLAVVVSGGYYYAKNKMAATNTTPAQQTSASTDAAPATNAPASTASGDLKVEDLKVGTGTEATAGKTVTVHYTGWLTDGKKFDSSLDHGQPFRFQLGAGQVIAGWDRGVTGMKIGGKRKLTIPPNLGYGERGAGNVIPPNSTLIFEVELLEVN